MCEHVHSQRPLGAVCPCRAARGVVLGCEASKCTSGRRGWTGADTDGRGQTRALHFGSRGSGDTRLGVSMTCVTHASGFEARERGLWWFQAASGSPSRLGGTLPAGPRGLRAGHAPGPGPCWWPAAARGDGEVAAPWALHNATCGDGQP